MLKLFKFQRLSLSAILFSQDKFSFLLSFYQFLQTVSDLFTSILKFIIRNFVKSYHESIPDDQR